MEVLLSKMWLLGRDTQHVSLVMLDLTWSAGPTFKSNEAQASIDYMQRIIRVKKSSESWMLVNIHRLMIYEAKKYKQVTLYISLQQPPILFNIVSGELVSKRVSGDTIS